MPPAGIWQPRRGYFLQRKDDTDYVFLEISEFCAADGTLIVTNTQNLTDQLSQTGYYVVSGPLSIPEDAPPRRYHLVGKRLPVKKAAGRVFCQHRRRGSTKFFRPSDTES